MIKSTGLAQMIWTLPIQLRINQSDTSVGNSKTNEADLHSTVLFSTEYLTIYNSTEQKLNEANKNIDNIRLQWLSILQLYQNITLKIEWIHPITFCEMQLVIHVLP